MSTTENTNIDSTYSGSLKQDNRRTKQVKYSGRLFSEERDIHSHVPSVEYNINAGLVLNWGKKLVDRFVAIGEEGAEQLNAFSRQWKKEIFWIYPHIPKIRKALIAWEKFKPMSIMMAPWWPGQILFIHLLTGSSRYIVHEESSLILNPGKEMTKMKTYYIQEKSPHSSWIKSGTRKDTIKRVFRQCKHGQ
ncbi:MAG: hypothetical protein EZS28_045489 [Streblomastix strix]|uniref:Uncharacterized protein n=1 Tax=Streblomastix strix TaxID=222440 RepID=A0A5J4TNG8_9EUKA|nr:MAG: hypothetical protein EZS28_045489 [Streblomastix strix]